MALYLLTFDDGGAVVRAKNGGTAQEICREAFGIDEMECARVHDHGDEEIVFAVEPSKRKRKKQFLDEKPD